MQLWQKIKQKIFFFFYGFLNKKEARVINKIDANASILHLIHILREQKIDRILVICDQNFEKQLYFSKLKENLQGAGMILTLYSEQVENPSVTLVEQCVHLFFSNSCQAILSIGGGSVIDLGKATKARALRPDKSLHKLKGLGKVNTSNKSLPLLITIPTTFTAGESSKTAWIIDHPNQAKYILNDNALQPNYVMHCAEYISIMPKRLIAATGLGTLTQAVEALLSTNNSQYIEQNAIEAISELLDKLEQEELFAKIDSETIVDLEKTNLAPKNQLIADLLNAAYQAGNASGRTLAGYVTAIANALAVYYDLPYSEVSAATLPLLIEQYLKHKPELFTNLSENISAEKILTTISSMQKKWELETNFPQINVVQIPDLIEFVNNDLRSIYSPPLYLSDEELGEILKALA